MMKKNFLILLASLLFLFIMYSFVFNFAVPKSASFFLPVKWQHIPLGEKKMVVHAYLGKPIKESISEDDFEIKAGNNNYVLQVAYDKDTIAENYAIFYFYKSWFINKRYTIKTEKQ